MEIENNLQAMKTRKSELDQEAIDAKKALERFQNQNASLNSAAEALKSRFRDSKIFQKRTFRDNGIFGNREGRDIKAS